MTPKMSSFLQWQSKATINLILLQSTNRKVGWNFFYSIENFYSILFYWKSLEIPLNGEDYKIKIENQERIV